MMAQEFGYVIFALLLFAIAECLVGCIMWRKRRSIQRQIMIERTQSRFAEARNKLMHLIIEGKLDSRSVTFKYLYLFNTVFMRHTDKYPQLTDALCYMSVKVKDDETTVSDILKQESKTWNMEVKEVALMTAKALNYIIIDYSFPVWFASKLIRWSSPRKQFTSLEILERLAKSKAKIQVAQAQALPAIKENQADLYKLARTI